MSKTTMNVYCCGGTGINIGSLVEAGLKDENPGFAKLVPIYIDTSKSNLTVSHPDSRTYLIPDLPREGAGKVRRENFEQIVACVPHVLNKFKPAEINIVISSTSGGSGSVIAPSLVSMMLEQGHLVIALAVGSTDSLLEITNTINTLKSYESMASLRDKPVPAIYWQNTPEQKRAVINEKLKGEIIRLAALFSGQNQGLDSSDLRNWLHYNRQSVTGYPAHLVSLEVHVDHIERKNPSTHVISVATLANDVDKISAGMPVDYQATGFLDPNFTNMNMAGTLHFALVDGYFLEVIRRLEGIVTEMEATKSASTNRKSIAADASAAAKNGMIL